MEKAILTRNNQSLTIEQILETIKLHHHKHHSFITIAQEEIEQILISISQFNVDEISDLHRDIFRTRRQEKKYYANFFEHIINSAKISDTIQQNIIDNIYSSIREKNLSIYHLTEIITRFFPVTMQTLINKLGNSHINLLKQEDIIEQKDIIKILSIYHNSNENKYYNIPQEKIEKILIKLSKLPIQELFLLITSENKGKFTALMQYTEEQNFSEELQLTLAKNLINSIKQEKLINNEQKIINDILQIIKDHTDEKKNNLIKEYINSIQNVDEQKIINDILQIMKSYNREKQNNIINNYINSTKQKKEIPRELQDNIINNYINSIKQKNLNFLKNKLDSISYFFPMNTRSFLTEIVYNKNIKVENIDTIYQRYDEIYKDNLKYKYNYKYYEEKQKDITKDYESLLYKLSLLPLKNLSSYTEIAEYHHKYYIERQDVYDLELIFCNINLPSREGIKKDIPNFQKILQSVICNIMMHRTPEKFKTQIEKIQKICSDICNNLKGNSKADYIKYTFDQDVNQLLKILDETKIILFDKKIYEKYPTIMTDNKSYNIKNKDLLVIAANIKKYIPNVETITQEINTLFMHLNLSTLHESQYNNINISTNIRIIIHKIIDIISTYKNLFNTSDIVSISKIFIKHAELLTEESIDTLINLTNNYSELNEGNKQLKKLLINENHKKISKYKQKIEEYNKRDKILTMKIEEDKDKITKKKKYNKRIEKYKSKINNNICENEKYKSKINKIKKKIEYNKRIEEYNKRIEKYERKINNNIYKNEKYKSKIEEIKKLKSKIITNTRLIIKLKQCKEYNNKVTTELKEKLIKIHKKIEENKILETINTYIKKKENVIIVDDNKEFNQKLQDQKNNLGEEYQENNTIEDDQENNPIEDDQENTLIEEDIKETKYDLIS